MNASLIVEDFIRSLSKKYGSASQPGKARIVCFGDSFACSINYSKLLSGHKFFYAVPRDIIDPNAVQPITKYGSFVMLVCGGIDQVLVLPRDLMIEMLDGVTSRRVDVFVENEAFILQTTKHPKLDVTQYLNAFPTTSDHESSATDDTPPPDRPHVRIQWNLIALGHAEGCNIWVPISDRNLSYLGESFAARTLANLPRVGFDESTRRIVQNIDVLWLRNNVICKAFEIESTTSIYSGLLRMNDLTLAQPNTAVDLYLVAPQNRRDKVATQLMRPSFRSLLPKVSYVSFDNIDESAAKLSNLPSNARVTGLITGERFCLPEHYLYPARI